MIRFPTYTTAEEAAERGAVAYAANLLQDAGQTGYSVTVQLSDRYPGLPGSEIARILNAAESSRTAGHSMNQLPPEGMIQTTDMGHNPQQRELFTYKVRVNMEGVRPDGSREPITRDVVVRSSVNLTAGQVRTEALAGALGQGVLSDTGEYGYDYAVEPTYDIYRAETWFSL